MRRPGDARRLAVLAAWALVALVLLAGFIAMSAETNEKGMCVTGKISGPCGSFPHGDGPGTVTVTDPKPRQQR